MLNNLHFKLINMQTKLIDGKEITWLSEEEYQKAVGQLRLQLNGVMRYFDMYGQDVFITQAVNEIIKLSIDFSLRVRGVDHPIQLD